MRILVTNDDGVDAPGIVALAAAFVAAGHLVTVVAPASDRSGASAAIGPLHEADPIGFEARRWEALPDVEVLAIDAPPATAVFAACIGAFGTRPELVASGVNPGANTGHLVLHSGTVGAALTAATHGVPAIAASVQWNDGEYHYDTAAALAAAAVDWVTVPGSTTRVLNLNVPNLPLEELRGVRDARLARYGEVWVASADVSRGDLRLEFGGSDVEPDPDSDLALLRAGYAAVTPLLGFERAPVDGAAAAIDAARAPDRTGSTGP